MIPKSKPLSTPKNITPRNEQAQIKKSRRQLRQRTFIVLNFMLEMISKLIKNNYKDLMMKNILLISILIFWKQVVMTIKL